MSRYRKVDPRFWKDEKVRRFNQVEKLITLYLFTGQSNRIGIFSFSPGEAAEDLGISSQTFVKGFGNVCRNLSLGWDSEARVLYWPTWWKYNQPENANNVIGNLKDLDDVPDSPLIERFINNLEYLPETLHQTFTQTLAKRYPKRSPSQEQEQEGNGASSSFGGSNRNGTSNPTLEESFNHFWNSYPIKTGKGAALRAWKKLKPNEELQAKILAAIEAQTQWREERAGDSNLFTPEWKHPTTWLNATAWEDQVENAGDSSKVNLPFYCKRCEGSHPEGEHAR